MAWPEDGLVLLELFLKFLAYEEKNVLSEFCNV
jgi:hypothetical protein